ncbi:hypothetical protein IFM89_028612 [Coptis chinensis]|uniref:RBR-type E3 ubiquitin transferase n=1 Tax=Coptis chinensis TaxID=261450 RepID=A0A835IEH2_9MAGN|nr:hypothetical protein IFM89_028612 [Coptis chinensis]
MGNTIQRSNQTNENLEENKQEDEDDLTFTCEICIEPVSINKRFKSNKKCFHHSYCVDCMEKYIEAKIEDYDMSKIKCPGLECDEFLDPHSCHSFLSIGVFERWCDVLCESTLLQCETAYCPYTDCSALILNECGGKVRKTKCPNCKKLLCFECKVPWHAGYSCNETGEMRDANDVLLGQLMEEQKWKRCPVCNHGVELSSGCKVVRCRTTILNSPHTQLPSVSYISDQVLPCSFICVGDAGVEPPFVMLVEENAQATGVGARVRFQETYFAYL